MVMKDQMLTGAQRPNWNAVPTTAPLPVTAIQTFIDGIKQEHRSLIESQSALQSKIVELTQQIECLTVQVAWFKRLHEEADEKLTKIKAHL